MIEEFILGLKKKKIGSYIQDYVDLYIRPIKTWRTVANKGQTGYDLVVLHLIYYCVIVVLLSSLEFTSKSTLSAIAYVFSEAAFTLIPVILFLPSFYLMNFIFKTKLVWTKLFRVFLILKLQILPFVIILLYFTEHSNSNFPLIILINVVFSLILMFVVVFPLVLKKIDWWKRAIWIFSNYTLIVIEFFVIGIAIIKNPNMVSKKTITAPFIEYTKFMESYNYAIDRINHSFFFMVYKSHSNREGSIERVQFATNSLRHSFLASKINQSDKYDRYQIEIVRRHNKPKGDSLLRDHEMFLEEFPKSDMLTIKYLDSLRTGFNTIFYSDLKLVDSLRQKTMHKLNKGYYNAVYTYLTYYQDRYMNPDSMLNKAAVKNPEIIIIDDNLSGLMFRVNNKKCDELKKEIENFELDMDRTMMYSAIVPSVVGYPVVLLLDAIVE